MTLPDPRPHRAVRIAPCDAQSEFRSGVHALDDYFRRHAVRNDEAGIGRAYVLRRSGDDDPAWPAVLGYFTLSMAVVEAVDVETALGRRLPRYPMPVALVGRLAVDHRVRGKHLGEQLLAEAIARAVEAAEVLGCVGIVVDAKDERAEAFYARYEFVTVHGPTWPRRMFLAMATARAALGE